MVHRLCLKSSWRAFYCGGIFVYQQLVVSYRIQLSFSFREHLIIVKMQANIFYHCTALSAFLFFGTYFDLVKTTKLILFEEVIPINYIVLPGNIAEKDVSIKTSARRTNNPHYCVLLWGVIPSTLVFYYHLGIAITMTNQRPVDGSRDQW